MGRERQRANRRSKEREIREGVRGPGGEEPLDEINDYGYQDPTPYIAVKHIILSERGEGCVSRSISDGLALRS